MTEKDWWRGAVIYQIYPRSFQDTNGDGVGDLVGITERLPYVASLGVDAIWISPFYPSPMLDFGYDVSDYRDVNPLFGSFADFDALLERAHALGLKVLIDLVLSHTSDQHPWFAESRASKTSDKADWYVWADPKSDGSPPNNWLSVFGGTAWSWDARRRQYYLHNFLAEQPDLNFHNKDVQDALLAIARFWLDRGVDGFRLDTINFYFHDVLLRDNPALAPAQRNNSIAPEVNPYNYQDHLHDKNRPENVDFLRRFRSVMEEYRHITAVGEVGDAQRAMEIIGAYTSGGDKIPMCYAFDFLAPARPTADRAAEILTRFAAEASDGWACWAFSNHDVVRHTSRWALDDAEQRLYATLLLCLKGSVCLYQGEELGLPEADIPFEALQDPYGKQFWPEFKGRDGCRTPMVWSAQSRYAGFSTAKPWLPMPEAHLPLAVSAQEENDRSMLAFYRKAIALRASTPSLKCGDVELLRQDGNLLSFVRHLPGHPAVFCAFNFGQTPQDTSLPPGDWRRFDVLGFEASDDAKDARLPPGQAYLAEAR